MTAPDTSSGQTLYYASINGQQRGPYQLDFIEALVLSGVCAGDVQVRREDKNHWVKLNSIIQPPSIPATVSTRQSIPPPVPPQVPREIVSRPAGRQAKGCGTQMTVILIVVVAGLATKTCNSTTSSYTAPTPIYSPPASTYTPPIPQTPIVPDQSQPSDSGQAAPQPPATPDINQPSTPALNSSVSPSIPANAPDTTDSVIDDSGQSYRVPHAYHSILEDKKAVLTNILQSINQLKTARDGEGRQIDTDRASLDNTDQAAVDRFNAEVNRYNQEGDILDANIDKYNAGIKDYNDYLSKIGTPSN